MIDSHSTNPADLGRSARAGGYVLGLVVQVVLVILILGQIVFLASRYRGRVDLTEQGLYTLTDSTKKILGDLDDRLIIEAYFSPDRELSAALGDARLALRNVLDEYVQNGRGRVVVQYLDPASDNDLRERAKRLGIQPQTVPNRGDRTLSYSEVWQGARLRYGENKKVLPLIQMQLVPYGYEMTLTPAIKALTVEDKPKIAMISAPVQGVAGQPPIDYRRLREAPEIKDRYQILPHSLQAGQLIPEHFESALLVRPRDLTDRQKFVLDQFLMRGGKLVVFADTDDYTIDPQRSFNRRVVAYDAKDSEQKFLDQLESYGVVVRNKLLLDGVRDVWEPFQVPGGLIPVQLTYPYWFFAADQDWASLADKFAKGADGKVDDALAAAYSDAFLPGVAEIAKGIGSPGFFWPCPVDLAEPMPEGLAGSVLLRTSPMALIEEPPQTVSPFGRARDRQQQSIELRKFHDSLMGRLNTEARRQYGLMVSVSGAFSSFFDGKEIPESPAMLAAIEAREKAREAKLAEDPLANVAGEDEAEHVGVELPPEDGDEGKETEDEDLPPLPDEPDPIFVGEAPGRLIVLGDSDFLRDDLIEGRYRRQGGPFSARSGTFFLNLLDWLAEDEDLFELRNKDLQPSKLSLVEDAAGSAGAQLNVQNQKIRSKEFWVRILNIAVPVVLLLAFGTFVFLSRSRAKRTFLESLD